jgi:hypothetical protein
MLIKINVDLQLIFKAFFSIMQMKAYTNIMSQQQRTKKQNT